MFNQKTRWLALDVGGANIKAAHSGGEARTLPFALWRDPGRLPERLHALFKLFDDFDAVAMTTTAELCDCFETKSEGVLTVLDSVRAACGEKPLRVWGVDGRFHDMGSIRKRPRLAAAANWLALATTAARRIGDATGLLIDIGSTTTDLIPLHGGRVVARGRTDTERLGSRELVYAGVRRTPVCAIATELDYRSNRTGLAAELFATTLDVFLTLREIAENPEDRDTADGKPATIVAARGRLARMVGADRVDFSERDAIAFAFAARDSLVDRLAMAAWVVARSLPECPTIALISGTGEFLARDVLKRLLPLTIQVVSLSDVWGSAAGDAACARALLDLLDVEFEAT